ncbi:MAG: hypothetical protein AMK70_10000, partial [Nitrospira bacterium SG8_35_1]
PVDPGHNQVFDFTPDPGYQVAEIWVDGERLQNCYLEEAPDVYDCVAVTSNSYVFTDVRAPHSIIVRFTESSAPPVSGPWTITVLPFSNGTIKAGGVEVGSDEIVDVGNGQSRSFSFIPDTGYYVAEVLVDGSPVNCAEVEGETVCDTSSPYVFSNVTKNYDFEVVFELPQLAHIPMLLEMLYPYYSIQSAYDDSLNDEIIYLRSWAFEDGNSPVFDRAITITLKGGYDAFYTDPPIGKTVIIVAGGLPLTISDGTVIFDNIIIR